MFVALKWNVLDFAIYVEVPYDQHNWNIIQLYAKWSKIKDRELLKKHI